jgi:hypothetical protein
MADDPEKRGKHLNHTGIRWYKMYPGGDDPLVMHFFSSTYSAGKVLPIQVTANYPYSVYVVTMVNGLPTWRCVKDFMDPPITSIDFTEDDQVGTEVQYCVMVLRTPTGLNTASGRIAACSIEVAVSGTERAHHP